MIGKMENPFLEGISNEQSEVIALYNKKFKGIEMNNVLSLMNYIRFNREKSQYLINNIKKLLGEEMCDLILKEYVDDVNYKTNKINIYSTLDTFDDILKMRKAMELLSENMEEIKKVN